MYRLYLVLVIFLGGMMITSSQEKEFKHIILYGQSFSTGNQSYPPISTDNIIGNYMIGDQVWITNGNTNFSDLSPLKSTVAKNYEQYPKTKEAQTLGESPIIGLTNHIQSKENNLFNYIATATGEGGKSLEALSKNPPSPQRGNFYNDYFLKAISSASTIAKQKNTSISCPAIFWMQGEYNYIGAYDDTFFPSFVTKDKDVYMERMIALKNDMQTDIMKEYRQFKKPVFITYQAGTIDNKGNVVSIGMGQLEASNIYSDVFCAGPTYYLPHRDIHLEPNAYRWYGEMLGKVYYKTQILKEDFKPLQPKKIYRIGKNQIAIQFHVPKLPLTFDTEMLEELPNYGFKITRDNKDLPIKVSIDGDKVLLTGKDLTGKDFSGNINVSYGMGDRKYSNGKFYTKAGNLRDSDDYQAIYTYQDLDEKLNDEFLYPRDEPSLRPNIEPKHSNNVYLYNQKYPLYNFSVIFTYNLEANRSQKIMPGFYKSNSEIIYVKKGSNGDGSSWNNAIGELYEAIQIVNEQNVGENSPIHQIWVANGIYTPAYRAGNGTTDRDRAFILPKDVKIYGGFNGTETSLSQRDWKTNVTVLSGDFNNDDHLNTNNLKENALHVVISAGNVGNTVLDGFTITGGNANGTSWNFLITVNGEKIFANCGGAIHTSTSSPKFNNLIITNNQAYASGGGIRADMSNLNISNSVISNNKIIGPENTLGILGGAGIFNNKGSFNLINSLITDNYSNVLAGGIYNESSKIKLINVSLISNEAKNQNSGGIYNDDSSSTDFYNSIIWKNAISNANSNTNYYHSFAEGITQKDDKGNIAGDIVPIFKNTTNKDYRLHPMCHFINKGNNSYLNNDIIQDLDGKNRIVGNIVDLGAFEYPNEENCLWEDIDFSNKIITFDKNPQNLNIENLPVKVTATYSYKGINGTIYNENENAPKDAGEYEVTAILIHPELECEKTLTAILKIEKKEYPDDIVFNDLTTDYNREIQSVEISGNIPAGTNIAYTNNSAVDAGVYNSAAELSNKNFIDKSLNATLTINKIVYPDYVVFNDLTTNFNGNLHSIEISGNIPANTDITYTDNSATDAGIYNASAALSNKNFIDKSLNATLTINKAEYPNDMFFNNLTTDYNGKLQSVEISGNIPANTDITYTDNSAVNVGIYNASAALNNINFIDKSLNATLTINKIVYPDDVVFNNLITNYNGKIQSIEVSGNIPADTDITYTDNSATDVGIYNASASLNNKNFIDKSLNATLTINKAEYPNDMFFNDLTTDYNGKLQSVEISGNIPAGTDIAYTNNSATDAGVYNASAALSNKNFINKSLNATLTINKAEYPNDMFFNDLTTDYNGKIQSVEISGNIPANTDITYTDNSAVNVGIYNASAALNNINFIDKSLNATLTINKIVYPDDVVFNNLITNYNGKIKSIEVSGKIPADTDITYTNNSATDAGVYNASAALSNKNFIDKSLNATLTINKIVYPNGIIFNDLTTNFNGNLHSIEVSGNIPAGTDIAYTNNSATDAGVYNASAALSNKNFINKSLNATLTINKIVYPDDIVFNNLTTDYNGKIQSVEISGNIPAGTNLAYTNNSATDVGIYNASAALNNINFIDKSLNATLTINKAEYPNDMFFNDLITNYNGKLQSVKISGNIPAGTNLAYTNNSATDVGVYNASASLNNKNFIDKSLNATLTINKAEYPNDIFFNDLTTNFNGDLHSIEVSGNIPAGTDIAYTNNSAVDAGVYNASAALSNKNFINKSLNATLTINKAEYPNDMFFNDLTTDYNGKLQSIEISGNIPAGTDIAYTNNSAVDAGVYNASATLSNKNFIDKSLNATLTINKAEYPNDMFFNDLTTDYNGKLQSVEISGNIPAGTDIAYTNNSATDAGVYNASAALSNKNFIDKSLNATLTINKTVYPNGIIFNDLITNFNGNLHSIEVSGNIPAGTDIAYTNNSAVDAGVYNASAALNNINFINKSLNATLTINKIVYPDDIVFNNLTTDYNGKLQSVEISGNIPANTDITYTDNSAVNAGIYNASATLSNKNFISKILNAALIINKIAFSENLTFEDLTTKYNDKEHTIEISGQIPEGTMVSYIGNKGTNAGIYRASAFLQNKNYNDKTLYSSLIINKAEQDIIINQNRFVYDGTSKQIVAYTNTGSELTYTPSNNINAGSYNITITAKETQNYIDTEIESILFIEKAQAEIKTESIQTFKYDGKRKEVFAKLNHNETILTYQPQKGYIETGVYQIKIYAKETNNYSATLKNVTLIIQPDNIEIPVKKITVTPNPAAKFIKVFLPNPAKSSDVIKIYNLTGRLFLTTTLKKGEMSKEINLEKLQNGTYILVYKNFNAKIIKNE